MQYLELVKQATNLAYLSDNYSDTMDSTDADRAFTLLKTLLLALNSDDRLTLGVEDIVVNLANPKLVLTPNNDYEPQRGEQVYVTGFPIEIAPAYVIAELNRQKIDQIQYENFLIERTLQYVYALRMEYGRAIFHFRYTGLINMGLKKPLALPVMITDEAELIGSALNLVICKLAKDICASKGINVSPELAAKYNEAMDRHTKIKRDILSPPVLTTGYAPRRIL